MREALKALQAWTQAGQSAALATVVRTWGSAPRRPGAKMAVSQAGEMAGSVSGGCVEAAVVEEALRTLQNGARKLLHFEVQDEAAWEVGLTCGGRLEVFIEPVGSADAVIQALGEAIDGARAGVRAVVVRGPADMLGQSALIWPDGEVQGALDPSLAESLHAHLRDSATSGSAQTWIHAHPEGEVEVFLDPVLPPATLIIVGAVHIAMALTRLAKVLGFRVVVIDPRRRFATSERFPEADALLTQWPDEGLRVAGLNPSTAVAVLSHDPKLDDPALQVALRSPAGYVGALGSRRTNARRRSRLLEAGLTEEELDRLHAPIGIDLGGDSPEEIALSIVAEVVAIRAAQVPHPGRDLGRLRARR
jgi:xanthine dehydrogenase accessory factor